MPRFRRDNKRRTTVSSVYGCSNAVDIANKFAVNFQEATNNNNNNDRLTAFDPGQPG